MIRQSVDLTYKGDGWHEDLVVCLGVEIQRVCVVTELHDHPYTLLVVCDGPALASFVRLQTINIWRVCCLPFYFLFLFYFT